MEENTQQPLDSEFQAEQTNRNGFLITSSVRQYWKEAANWGLFFSVLGFVYLGILVLSMGGLLSVADIGNSLSLLMLLIVLAIVAPLVWLLFNFSRFTRKAVSQGDTFAAHVGFANLRRLFHYWGILTVAVLVIYGLIVLMTVFAIGNG